MSKTKKYLCLIGLLIFFSSPFVLASHLVGGKITYRYLGANKYEYTLTVYRDCSDQVGFNDPATIHIYDKANNNPIYIRNVKLTNKSVVPPFTPNPCFVPPSGICVEVGNYIDTVMLAPNAMGYAITHQNCCHNGSVLNIVVPTSTGMAITTDIPAQINNSSKFNNSPPNFICLSDTFNYSFASTDVDGDSLVYQFCTPFKDGTINYSGPFVPTPPPYNPLNWVTGFSATNPLPNSSGVILNSSTGQLKFKSSMTGQFAVGICVLEYRNNSLINTNRLEVQFNVVNCYLVSSIPTATNLCEGLTIPFQNSSTNANSFHWDFGDLSSTADTSNLFSPTYTFPNYGTYTVSLMVYNTAYGFCKDSSKKIINVNPLLSPTLQPTYSSCFSNNNINFNIGGAYHPSATFSWNFTSNSSTPSVMTNPATVHFTTPTPKTLSVVVTQFGCKDTLYSSVTFTNPIAASNLFNLNCNEKSLLFPNWSSNAISYFWNFGDPSTTTDTSSQASPSYTYSVYGNYPIYLVAYNGSCSDTLRDTIKVFPKLQLNWDTLIQKQCFKNNSFNFTPSGIWGGSASFSWLFYNSPNVITSTLQNPTNIQFTNSGNHLIKISVSENGCTKNAQAVAVVFPDPKASVILSDSSGCEPLAIKFKNISDSLHPVNLYWNINGNLFSDTTVFYQFPNAGSYSYSLVVIDGNNCSDTVNRTNYIQIFPKPIVKSFVTPLSTNILYPQITFIDSTQTVHSTYFNFGDGNTSVNPENNYNYQGEGDFPYTLIVTNQFGCTDTATGIIKIDGIASNYVPNIFTPNGDGVNENFFIKGKSITNSSMQIFNRWGKLVCESSNALDGWNGLDKDSGDPCSTGTYFYVIKISLENGKSYSFNGAVQLQR